MIAHEAIGGLLLLPFNWLHVLSIGKRVKRVTQGEPQAAPESH
ncbi:hypothetical protein [Pseudomonas sp. MPB26]